jgi:hypothetical protein
VQLDLPSIDLARIPRFKHLRTRQTVFQADFFNRIGQKQTVMYVFHARKQTWKYTHRYLIRVIDDATPLSTSLPISSKFVSGKKEIACQQSR